MRLMVHKTIQQSKYDKTFKAQVIGKASEGKYRIRYKGKEYTASCQASLSSEQIVRVCAPQNDWSDLFIVSY